MKKRLRNEWTIMPPSPYYSTQRFNGSHRHEVFYGTANRQKSIEDGLVIFLKPEHHNMSNDGIHFNKEFDNKVKKIAQKRWMEFYSKSEEQFIKRYGKSYL